MRLIEEKGHITLRSFLKGSAKAAAGAGLLATFNSVTPAEPGPHAMVSSDPVSVDKIALEEHFVIPETLSASYGALGGPEFQRQLEDIGSERTAQISAQIAWRSRASFITTLLVDNDREAREAELSARTCIIWKVVKCRIRGCC